MTWDNAASSEVDLSNGEVILGSVAYSWDDSMPTLSTNFYEDPEGNKEEIKEYGVFYLIKAEFTDNDTD